MNLRTTLYLLVLIVATQVFFACSTAKYYDFGSRGAYGDKQVAKAAAAPEQNTPEAALPEQAAATQAQTGDLAVEASAADLAPAPAKPAYLAAHPQKETTTAAVTPVSKTERKQMVKEMKASIKAAVKENKKAGNTGSPNVVSKVLLVILAILLPPLAVFLVRGLSGAFWLSILLWLLFILPGVIYALYIVLTD